MQADPRTEIPIHRDRERDGVRENVALQLNRADYGVDEPS